MSDLRLEHDLACPGDALFVGGDGLQINLNGHSITGAGVGIGITLRGRSGVTIHGGTITNFLTGIFAATSTRVVIKDNAFTENREAVFFAGTTFSVVKANVAWQNSQRGFMVRPTGTGVLSTNNDIVDNILTDNPSGILLFAQPLNTIKGNTISGSSVGAIDLTGGGASGNEIKENLLTASDAGIKFGLGWSGNSIIGNTIQANVCGIQGPGETNIYKDNQLITNAADYCP